MAKLGYEDDDQEVTDQSVALQGDDEARKNDPASTQEDTDDTVVVADEGDKRLHAETTEEDEEEQPRRNRETAKQRRERARLAKERDKQEIDLLRRTTARQDARLQQLEKSLVETRVTDLDARIATAIQEAEQMDRVFAAAITKQNGEDARKAAELRDQAKQRAWALHTEKEQVARTAQVAASQPKPVPYQDKALQFLSDKQWYNPQSGDEDSLVVEALDKALSKKMDPNDPRYWDTLNQKVRERLPHRFESQDEDGDDDADPAPRRESRKGPPTGGSSRDRSSGGVQQIRLPAEMVEAMKEAGQWDDPKVRQRVAKRYIDGLRNNRG